MTIKEWAEKLNGREYMKEITPDEEIQAKNEGIVIVFGASDDLMEFRGAIRDEIDCYDGGIVWLNKKELLENECNNEDCPYFESKKEECATIEAIWDSARYSWIYETEIPHEIFDIFEDTEPYCRGIIFKLEEVKL